MLVDPNTIYLGSEVYNDNATIHFVDGDLTVHDNDEDIDPETLDKLWSIDVDAEGMHFHNEATGEDVLFLGENEASFGSDIGLGGDVSSLNVTDNMIRLSGFTDVFEFRRSSTDWDQMFEFHRNSNSDYEMYLHRGGDPHEVVTVDHDIDATYLGGTHADNYLEGGLNIRSNGTVEATDIDDLNFGNDLGVDVTTTGVNINFVGAQIPARVLDNGTEILEDANGINFLDDLNVAVGTDNVAEITVDLPDGVLDADGPETITGPWSFSQQISGSIDSADNATFADTADGLTSSAASDFLSTSENVTITGTHTHQSRLRVDSDTELTYGGSDEFRQYRSSNSGNLIFEDATGSTTSTVRTVNPFTETVNYQYAPQHNGNDLATETWVENSADTFDPTQSYTFTADQHFEAGVDASGGDYIAFPAHSTTPDYSTWPDGAGWFQTDEV